MQYASADSLCILLVDDEPKVINGLERSIALLEDDWDVLVAYGGLEALEILDSEDVDVVLSDLRMPVMDGAAFLAKAREAHPSVIRLILSGYADKDLMMDATHVAHRYLVKPSSAQDVVDAVRHVWQTMEHVHNDDVAGIVAKSEGLVSGDGPISELLNATNDPECSMDTIKELVEKHPSVCASILKISNTAFFGSGGHVETVDEAFMILGFDFIKALAIVELTKKELNLTPEQEGFANTVFEHCVESSHLVSFLKGSIKDYKMVQRIQSIALLHDLGKLILLDFYGDRYLELCADSMRANTSICKLEKEKFGCDHAVVGAYLFNLWGFPNEVVQGISGHHKPAAFGDNQFSTEWLMFLINSLHHTIRENDGYWSDGLPEGLLGKYSLTEDLIEEIKLEM